jgi:phenolic acid decarboxylase
MTLCSGRIILQKISRDMRGKFTYSITWHKPTGKSLSLVIERMTEEHKGKRVHFKQAIPEGNY